MCRSVTCLVETGDRMKTMVNARQRKPWITCLALLVLVAPAYHCSQGALPGSPSPLNAVGGAARYRGTLTYTRLAGGFSIDPPRQQLDLSIVLGAGDQLSGRFEAAGSTGTLQGVMNGTLSSGSFTATLLVSTEAAGPGGQTLCEGSGQVIGAFAGRDVTWRASDVTYDNCPGLVARSEAEGAAYSPVPGTYAARANVVVSVLPSTVVQRGTCPGSAAGWPFTVAVSETSGIDVQIDSTFTIEERNASGAPSRSVVETPFRSLAGGGRREYQVCAPAAGTYQAFFAGTDTRGNRVRFASPLVRLAE
jgi:hypothetical protein